MDIHKTHIQTYFRGPIVVTLQPELGRMVTEVVTLLLNLSVYQSLTLSFINSIKGLRLGNLYAHFLIPYRSLKRQTGLTKQVFQHHMLDKLRQSRDCDHRCQSINFKPKGSEDIIGWT